MATTVLNFNIGVLGHVDSGKTSLAKALSVVASTASFDKNPQSKERGITLDLGFSSFSVDIPDHLKDGKLEKLQFTLVDCPGHASLIRTIIGGAQIIDMMMLVIDITKGMQTQTAECLVIGEIACERMIVILNKIDLVPEGKSAAQIEKMTKRMHKTLESTKFANCPVIPVAAKPGGPEAEETEGMGVSDLIETLKKYTFKPQRDSEGSFIYAVDHCFSIRGQGTVITGTVLNGCVNVNDTIEIPAHKISKKVKSMQMFHKPVNRAIQGDRVGICMTQFDPKLLERGLVSTPNALPTIEAGIISVKKIPYFKGTISTKSKFHVTMGHETVMAKVFFFGYYGDINDISETLEKKAFNYNVDYKYLDEFVEAKGKTGENKDGAGEDIPKPAAQFAILEFEKPVTCAKNCLVIGSKLDTDIHTNTCRLAFHGTLLEAITDTKYHDTILPNIKIYKNKFKEGVVERKADDYSVICKGLFKKESNMEMFTGLKVKLSTGEDGMIEGGFGQSGKFKVRLPNGLSPELNQILAGRGKKGKGKGQEAANQDPSSTETIHVTLAFKRYVYDPKKKMIQA